MWLVCANVPYFDINNVFTYLCYYVIIIYWTCTYYCIRTHCEQTDFTYLTYLYLDWNPFWISLESQGFKNLLLVLLANSKQDQSIFTAREWFLKSASHRPELIEDVHNEMNLVRATHELPYTILINANYTNVFTASLITVSPS